MTYSRTSITKILSAAVITCAVAAFYTVPAAAQNATKLSCSGCVKSKQIRNGGVKNKDLQDNAVNGQKIADGTVGNADLGGDSVTGDKILDGAVGNADLGNNAVNSAKVQNNSLNSADVALLNRGDISDEAGADFQGANESETITSTDETVRQVNISAPSNGRVIVMASGTWDENANPTTGRCSITTGVTVDTSAVVETSLPSDPEKDLNPFAATRGFVVGAGTTAFRLVCDITAVAGNAFLRDAQMTAMYFPTQY